MPGHGLILAAPGSGSGKTTVTLGLLRALKRRGVEVRGAKSGPDYIDPRFHEAACGIPCDNLDAWAMSAGRLRAQATTNELLLIEGAMGLFDGAPPDGTGATADLARILSLPVVLVVDAARMSQSVAPLVAGFAQHDPRVRVTGVILNRVGSLRHERMLCRALSPLGIPVLGALPRNPDLALPDRHLGLVQAQEHPDLEDFLERAADAVEAAIDLQALQSCAGVIEAAHQPCPTFAPAAGAHRIAIARDAAFTFVYAHDMLAWQHAGAEIRFFSPLADEPVPNADFVFLPGGYPELFAPQIACAKNFMQSLNLASQNSVIYGECGGYMVLGQGLRDADGQRHKMAGLLDLETSFANRKLHLGYRDLRANCPALEGRFAAHEFHYARTERAEGTPLFEAYDAEGTALPPMGLQSGNTMGSFAHVIGAR